MKTLLLLRHSKAAPDQPGRGDHDRPLTDRGKRDATRAGDLLRERGLLPDRILTSTARRARKTAKRAGQACGSAVTRDRFEDLYLAPPEAYITRLRDLPDDVASVLVVGHNPGLEDLLHVLAETNQRLPTTGLAHLQVPIDSWSELQLGVRCQLAWFWSPHQED